MHLLGDQFRVTASMKRRKLRPIALTARSGSNALAPVAKQTIPRIIADKILFVISTSPFADC